MYGRYELPVYQHGCRRCRNFIVETQGGAKYRTGTRYVHHTRLNKTANLLPFEFNDEQAYQLEFTDRKLRFYKDEGIITFSSVTITGGITQANPGVVTAAGHGYSNGDEVFIEEVVGMIQVNGRSFIVAGATANTFQLTDVDGNNVNTTGFTAYSSGGVCKKVVELTTPYDEDNDLFALKTTQDADTMYIVHPYYEPRKLTRTSHTSWSLGTFTRTADPFTSQKTITGITQANPGVVTSVGHGYVTGDVIIIEAVSGMTEINSQPYKVVLIGANTFSLTDLNGVAIDTTGFTAYTANGYASKQNLLPTSVTFYESRLWYAGPDATPDKFFGSRSPNSTGDPRYDDFTTGTDADHSVQFTIADSKVNKILWMVGTDRLLFMGTFGSEVKVTGETIDKPITPTSVNVKPIQRLGVADILPINQENIPIYVQRGKLTLRSFEFDALQDSFISVDRNLVSDHITEGGLKQMAWQSGRPDLVWIVREDGVLLGITFKTREDVSGWHRHTTYSGVDLFKSVSIMPRTTGTDQVWFVVERVVNGLTRRYIEFFEDDVELPLAQDFFTDEDSAEDDAETFARAIAEAQKSYVHVDSALTFDGSSAGLAAGATMTPAAVTGSSVVFTASAAIFKSSDVGKEIRKKAINGVGYGRAEILTFTDTTHVTCRVIDDFDSVTAMAAGNWYLTTNSLINLHHLEARSVAVVADGSEHSNETVSGGAITLDYQASVIHVGLGYEGFLQTMEIEGGGVTGPSQTKTRNISELGLKFYNSLGAAVGTDLYASEDVPFSQMPLNVGDPQPVYTGVKRVPYSDSWDENKHVYIRQTHPLPCVVQQLVSYIETDND